MSGFTEAWNCARRRAHSSFVHEPFEGEPRSPSCATKGERGCVDLAQHVVDQRLLRARVAEIADQREGEVGVRRARTTRDEQRKRRRGTGARRAIRIFRLASRTTLRVLASASATTLR